MTEPIQAAGTLRPDVPAPRKSKLICSITPVQALYERALEAQAELKRLERFGSTPTLLDRAIAEVEQFVIDRETPEACRAIAEARASAFDESEVDDDPLVALVTGEDVEPEARGVWVNTWVWILTPPEEGEA